MGKRPLSVWVLCLGNGLLAVFLITSSLIAEERGYAPWQAAISGICGLGLTLSAHAAWFGNRLGRNLLLAIITLFLGLLVVQSAMTLFWAWNNGYQGPIAGTALTRICLSLLWLVVNYAFLLSKRARVFFS
jgi:hypothetical protein